MRLLFWTVIGSLLGLLVKINHIAGNGKYEIKWNRLTLWSFQVILANSGFSVDWSINTCVTSHEIFFHFNDAVILHRPPQSTFTTSCQPWCWCLSENIKALKITISCSCWRSLTRVLYNSVHTKMEWGTGSWM